MRLCSTSSKFTSLKNGCLLISSASPLAEPRRRVGSRVSNCKMESSQLLSNMLDDEKPPTFCKTDTASRGIVIGYNGSSSKMASKISSSSSPRKGDCPSNISYINTPNAHQSTARP